MAIIKRIKDMLLSEVEDKETIGAASTDPNSDIERRLAAMISCDISDAESSKESSSDDLGLTIEQQWEDEYKLRKGGGLQWTTNLALRSKRARQVRPNSEDNFIHNSMQIMTGNITATEPEVRISGRTKHAKHAEKITHISRFNDMRNNFPVTWNDMVDEFISYGPIICKVVWDPEWIGGVGPDRWVGEVRLEHVYKEEFLPDPGILDLQKDKEKGRYHAFKSRQTLSYLGKRFPKFKKYLMAENNEDELVDEGPDPEMADLYEVYYKGFPEYMPEDRAKELRERADMQEEQGDHYKAIDLRDMAKGDLEGVHLAYFCNDLLLEYIPYVYDDGLYPFAFITRFKDPKNQWGYGEIRNIKIPQILHNKADEIEIEAMAKEGLGGNYYQNGAVNPDQLEYILENSGKGGMWFEVDNIDLIKERTGVRVPGNIPNYKEHKQRMIDTISQVTPIQQGMAPGANMPFKAIAELGARTDVRTNQAAKKLKDFLKEINKLRINRFAQSYTEDRYYRYTDSSGEVQDGTFRNDEIFDVWARETVKEQQIDPATGEMVEVNVERNEYFVPEFDIDVTIISKKPDDRNYYTSIAFELFNRALLTGEDLLSTLEEGKLPPNDEILKHVYAQDQMKQLMAQMGQLPQELQQVVVQQIGQQMQEFIAQIQQMQTMQQGGGME